MTSYNELRDGQEFYANGYKKGYEDAKNKFARLQDEWIPVSERLPEKNGKCLVTTDFGDVCEDRFVDGIFVLYLGNVIAWRPFPEPYKKGSTENN